jgi:HTH-type transcriptional regulator/antitoxin HipB
MMDDDAIPIETAADLGRIVRSARKQAGFDQAKTAGLAGVGTRFLGELERGKGTLRLGLALQVLHRLGLEIWVRPRGGFRSAGSS